MGIHVSQGPIWVPDWSNGRVYPYVHLRMSRIGTVRPVFGTVWPVFGTVWSINQSYGSINQSYGSINQSYGTLGCHMGPWDVIWDPGYEGSGTWI